MHRRHSIGLRLELMLCYRGERVCWVGGAKIYVRLFFHNLGNFSFIFIQMTSVVESQCPYAGVSAMRKLGIAACPEIISLVGRPVKAQELHTVLEGCQCCPDRLLSSFQTISYPTPQRCSTSSHLPQLLPLVLSSTSQLAVRLWILTFRKANKLVLLDI